MTAGARYETSLLTEGKRLRYSTPVEAKSRKPSGASASLEESYVLPLLPQSCFSRSRLMKWILAVCLAYIGVDYSFIQAL